MSQLTDNLNLIASIKSDIKDAIEAKGVDMTGVSFGSYADKIGEITTQFVTEPLNVTDNGTYTPGQGVDGFSQVTVNVPQSVSGFTQKDLTEKTFVISDLSNSASFVGSNAFANNADLRTINLPMCRSVYTYAFSSCKNLSYVSLPVCEIIYESAFVSCSSLVSIELPECKSVYNGAFGSCYKLQSISLPKCMSVSGAAFGSCSSLQSINLPECLSMTGQVFFRCSKLQEVSLPKCIYISGRVFDGCSSLQHIEIPELKYIGGSTFQSCKFSSLSFSKCLFVSDYGFQNCRSLSSISLPNCYYLGGIAFQYCSLTELSLPCCGYISGAVVNDCPSLTKVYAPMTVSFQSWYGNPAFCAVNLSELHICVDTYGCPSYSLVISTSTSIHKGYGSVYVNIQNYDYFMSASGWSNISSLIVSVGTSTEPLISFSDGLLYGSTRGIASDYSKYTSGTSGNITRISLPYCEYVHQSTFLSCYSVSEIYIPNCRFLGQSAFARCSSLTSVDLGLCSYIGYYAFSGATSLISICLRASEACYLEQTGLWNFPLSSIFVPASLVDAYKSANHWSIYSSRIFPIPEQ